MTKINRVMAQASDINQSESDWQKEDEGIRREHLRVLAEFSAFHPPHQPVKLHMFFTDGVGWPSVGDVDHGAKKELAEWQGRSVAIDPEGMIDILVENKAIAEPDDMWAKVLVIPPAFIESVYDKHTLGNAGRDAMRDRARQALEYVLEHDDVIYDCRKTPYILYEQPVYRFRSTFGTVYAGPKMPENVSAKVCRGMITDIVRYLAVCPIFGWSRRNRAVRIDREFALRAFCTLTPLAYDVCDFYRKQEDQLYYAAKPECLQHEHRALYEQALKMAEVVMLTCACIQAQLGENNVLSIPEDDEDAKLMLLADMKKLIGESAAPRYRHALLEENIPFEDLAISFPDEYFPRF